MGAGVSVIVVSEVSVATADFGVSVDVSRVVSDTSTVSGAVFSTTFVHIGSGEGGATTAAATADLVFCTSLQHFEQKPPVAAFPCKWFES